MSSISQNESISKKESQDLEDEDKMITKYILDLKNQETRDEAMKMLYSFTSTLKEKIALYLWYSGGTIALLLQELIKLYPLLPPFDSKQITRKVFDKVIQILSFFQCLAENPKTKKELIESGILVYILPFLSIEQKNPKKLYLIKVSVLSVIHSLVEKKLDMETFNFLKQHQIMLSLLKIIKNGKELDKTIACHSIYLIISKSAGIEYFCEQKERLKAMTVYLGNTLINDDCLKIKRFAIKIFFTLVENNEVKNMIKPDLLDIFKNNNVYKNLDENTKNKAKQLEKILRDKDTGSDVGNSELKIQKLKSDLTNNLSNNNTNVGNNSYKNKKNEINNLNSLNLNKSNSFTGFNNANQKQMNLNNNDYNSNKLNLNMMFINNMNNMNQMKMSNGYMMPPIGEVNYNLNKDNEGYKNPNMYNQNGNAGFGNMNFYNSYKNI